MEGLIFGLFLILMKKIVLALFLFGAAYSCLIAGCSGGKS
jgi:hypothetical protein